MGASWLNCAVAAVSGVLLLTIALPAPAQNAKVSVRERGHYLVDAGDCAACHTADGGKPFAGGRAIRTPFGTLYSSNITPDPGTGIGRWSNKDFYKAMHEGIGRGGKRLYPAFPYPWFTKVGIDDVRAIKAYLDAVPPVRQKDKPSELIEARISR